MNYNHSGFYLLRTPMLPFNNINHLRDNEFFLKDDLKTFFKNKEYEKAMYIASKDLHHEFKNIVSNKIDVNSDKESIVFQILLKYYIRMSTRPTPFGLFSGVSMGKIGLETNIVRKNSDNESRIRLDMSCLLDIVNYLISIPEIQNQLLFYPNSSIHTFGNEIRYIDYSPKNNDMNFCLTKVDSSPYLQDILQLAKNGINISKLSTKIANNEISQDQATSFIRELIKNNILVSEIAPRLTGKEFNLFLLERIKTLNIDEKISEKLIPIYKLLNLNNKDLTVEHLFQIESIYESIIGKSYRKNLFQADLFFQFSENSINESVINEIKNQCLAFWGIFGESKNSDLDRFKLKFYEKYQDQEISLQVALDFDLGIGYGSSTHNDSSTTHLLSDIFNTKKNETEIQNEKETIDYWLEQKVSKLIDKNEMELEIMENEIDFLNTKKQELPDGFYLLGQLIGSNKKAIDLGNFNFVLKVGAGMSGANYISRFCYGIDSLSTHLSDHVKKEENNNPDAIYAEIVHLPRPRVGNILQRPNLRDYEIIYLGNGDSDIKHKITINDLFISIKNNKLILRSKRLNKRVIPRLTTAHFYDKGIPVYKFLCDLQFENQPNRMKWNWRRLKSQTFLPRIRYKNIIIEKASWNINVFKHIEYDELILKNEKKIEPWVSAVSTTIIKLNIFKFVSISSHDNELFIDLTKNWGLKILANTLRKKKVVKLYESLNTNENCFINSKDGGLYTNEIVIPFYKKYDSSKSDINNNLSFHNYKSNVKRNFYPIPKEKWLYVKIYCGTKISDEFLKNIINPFTKKIIEDNLITKFFFIRYNDPDFHLRIRFLTCNPESWVIILNLLKDYIDLYIWDENIYNLQIDSYRREVERYGNYTIEFSESVFHHDSIATLDLLELCSHNNKEKDRWIFCLISIDMLFEDFGFNLDSKKNIINNCFKSFFKEFGGDNSLKEKLYTKYRSNKTTIEKLLDNHINSKENFTLNKILLTRSKNLRQEINNLTSISNKPSYFSSVINSYIHMLCNRMFTHNQRKYELVIYYFLLKYYESKIIRLNHIDL